MESDDLTVGGRLFQTLGAAILKALEAVTVLVLDMTRRSKTAERNNLAGLESVIMDAK